MSERPYSRHYHELVDDPKFAEVYDDDHHYACWSRLLMLADQAWPASAHIPATARKSSVAKLAEVGLIDLQAGGRFRMHGMQAERNARAEHARDASNARWSAHRNARSNAGASDTPMPRQAKQSKDETRQADQLARDPADILWTLTGRYPQDKAIAWIDDLTREYGPEAVIGAVVEVHRADPSGQTLIGRAQDRLRQGARALSVAAQKAERERIEERRAQPRTVVDEAQRQAILRELLGDVA